MTCVKAHFDGRVIVPDEPLDLPSGQRLLVHFESVDVEADQDEQDETVEESLLDWIVTNAVDDPALPTDFAEEHDRYLYGTSGNEA